MTKTAGMIRVAALALAVALVGAVPVSAKTFEPTRKDDPVPNGCKPRNCSFREALLAANKRQGHDVVVLRRGRYEMELLPDQDDGTSGRWWGYDVTIRGKGPRKTTLDGNGLDSVLLLGNFLDSNTLRGVRVTGGHSTAPGRPGGVGGGGSKVVLQRVLLSKNFSDAGSGGGARIDPGATFKMVNSRVVDNEAVNGGGVFLEPGSAAVSVGTIVDSTISGNEAVKGGGLWTNLPRLTITRTTIAQNAGDEGGGIDQTAGFSGIAPITKVASSTISGNTARKGGGILADGNQPQVDLAKPTMNVVNSTVAGNSTSAEGGGIMADNAATVNLDNATVAFNTADNDNLGGGVGGGVHQHSGAVLGVGDSIVAANNVGSSGTGPQCVGDLSDADGLLYQSQPTGTCSFAGAYTIVADAGLLPLADNGGPTQTVKLVGDSPAIGLAHTCPRRDQRGRRRPADCDTGALENKPLPG